MNKLETISNLSEGDEIRSICDSEKKEYYFYVVDVIIALTKSDMLPKYWNVLKKKLEIEGSKLSAKIGQLNLKSKDGDINKPIEYAIRNSINKRIVHNKLLHILIKREKKKLIANSTALVHCFS